MELFCCYLHKTRLSEHTNKKSLAKVLVIGFPALDVPRTHLHTHVGGKPQGVFDQGRHSSSEREGKEKGKKLLWSWRRKSSLIRAGTLRYHERLVTQGHRAMHITYQMVVLQYIDN